MNSVKRSSRDPPLCATRGSFPRWIARAIACVVLGIDPGLSAAGEVPSYREHTGSFFLPFAPKSSFEKVLRVRVRINGGPITELLIDTGSTGLVLGQGLVGSYDPDGRQDEFVYSSDGQVNHGVWNDVAVEFVDGRGLGAMRGIAPVARLQALIVRSVTCRPSPYATACHPGPAGNLPAMMGIGFGPIEHNALLNLPQGREGQMRRGYIIEPRGLRVGLTGADVLPDFSFVKLERADPLDPRRLWKSPAATISATLPDGGGFRGDGEVLMDSGIGGLFLALPGAPSTGVLPGGTSIRVRPRWIGEGPELAIALDGEASSPVARAARWVRMPKDPSSGSPVSFVNTGLRPMGSYRYLYDAEGGYWGLQRRR
jgi:hypothetical protein